MTCLNFLINVFYIAIWKFLSLYEAVTWDIFLRLFAVFCWIVWNFISVFILVTCLNFLINVLCIAIWKFLSLYEAVAWNIFLRSCTFLSSCSWNYISIFIFMSCCNFLIDVFCISFFVYFSFNNLISWDIFRWFSSVFCWWKWVTIFINEWCIRTYCWSVLSCYWCTVLIYTFNCYTFSFSYEVWFWCECYFTIFINSVSPFAWYFLLSCTIVKCWFNSFIDFNWNFLTVDCNFSTFKCWCSWLRLSFRTFWFRIFWSWCYWNDYWSVLSCDWCAVLIYTFNSYTCCLTSECLLWCEGYFTVLVDCVSSFAWYILLSCSIFECWLNSFVDFYSFFFTIYSNFSTFKCWCSFLSSTLNICSDNIWTCWCCWFHNWCVSSFNWCAVLIFALNCDTCSFTCEVLFWCECNCSIWRYCVCSFTFDSYWINWISCFRIYQFSWFIFVDFNRFFFTIYSNFSTFKCWFTCLSWTLDIFSYCICSCWYCFLNNWCVSSFNWCAVLIFALNCDTCSFTCEVLFWCECNCSIWSYCVCSFTIDSYWINRISCFWIYQFSWFIFVDFNRFLFTIDCYCSTLEFWFTCLSWTLNIFSYSICSCWCYWFDFRCVCSFSWCAVLILTNYFNTFGYSCKLWFWLKGYCSIWSYCVCSFTFYSDWINLFSSFWIYQFSWYCIVDFNSFLFTINHSCSTLEYWFTCLSCTLNIDRFCWFCFWLCRNDWWSVSCRNFSSICVLCLNVSWCYFTSVRFICWCEGYFTCCWIDWVSTYWGYSIFSVCWSCLSCWNFISFFIKKFVWILFNWSNSVSRSECWSSFLNVTLDSFWFSWFCCWCYWSN